MRTALLWLLLFVAAFLVMFLLEPELLARFLRTLDGH